MAVKSFKVQAPVDGSLKLFTMVIDAAKWRGRATQLVPLHYQAMEQCVSCLISLQRAAMKRQTTLFLNTKNNVSIIVLHSDINSLKSGLLHLTHRDKTRVQRPAKMFRHLKSLCLLLMGPTFGLDAKQRNSFLIKFGGFFFTNKARF